MKILQVNPKLLTFILFFLFLLPSCNNEELFVIDESTIIAEDIDPIEEEPIEENEEEEPNTEDVIPINAVDDEVFTMENEAVDIEAYINDENLSENITVTNTNPTNGVLSINTNDTPEIFSDDTIVYTPNTGFSGLDSFEYTVCDATNAENCDTATVNITIEAIEYEDDFATELKAFPTAIGAGANATGGRGGTVCHVNTYIATEAAVYDSTTDTYSGGLKSLMLLDIPAKQIVFDIAGTFPLGGYWDFNGIGNITISGQTAPGKVVIESDNLSWIDTHNIIMRYISMYNVATGRDVLWIQSSPGFTTDNIIIDHVSTFYGGDECLSIASSGGQGVINNVTIQNTLMAASSKGAILGSYEGETDATMAYCAFVDVSYRFPNPNTYGNGQIDMINIFAENYGGRLIRVTGSGKFNVQNFYAQPNRVNYGEHRLQYKSSAEPFLHSSGMIMVGVKDTPTTPDFDMWSIFDSSDLPKYDPLPESIKVNTPMSLVGKPFTVYPANEVKSKVLPFVGNNKRLGEDGSVINDSYALDDFYLDLGINQVATTSAIRYPADQYPIPSNGTAYTDTDKDGMPDVWEIANGFNPNLNDASEDRDGDSYTNIEEFLNIVDKD